MAADNLESVISAAVADAKDDLGDTSNTNDVETGEAFDTSGRQLIPDEPDPEVTVPLVIPETETPPAAPKAEEPPAAELSPEAKAAKEKLDAETKKKADEDKELGPATDKRGRENRIPYSAVKRISANAEKRGEERAKASFEPQLAEKSSLVTEYEKRLTAIEQVEKVMFEDVERFLDILPTINPAYAKYIQKGQAVAAAPPQAVDEERPKADYEFAPGKWTYSPEGLDKLVAWTTSQAEKRILEKVQPLTDAFEGSKRTQAHIADINARVEHAARNWKGFAENQEAILGVLRADKSLTLEGAYRVWRDKVHSDELAAAKADREKLRAELLAEIKQAPLSTSTAPAARKATPPPADPNADPIDAAIRAAIRTAKAS